MEAVTKPRPIAGRRFAPNCKRDQWQNKNILIHQTQTTGQIYLSSKRKVATGKPGAQQNLKVRRSTMSSGTPEKQNGDEGT